MIDRKTGRARGVAAGPFLLFLESFSEQYRIFPGDVFSKQA